MAPKFQSGIWAKERQEQRDSDPEKKQDKYLTLARLYYMDLPMAERYEQERTQLLEQIGNISSYHPRATEFPLHILEEPSRFNELDAELSFHSTRLNQDCRLTWDGRLPWNCLTKSVTKPLNFEQLMRAVELKQVQRHETNPLPFKLATFCHDCGFEAVNETALLRHLEAHEDWWDKDEDRLRIICWVCQLPFDEMQTYVRHVYRRHTKPNPYHSNDCRITCAHCLEPQLYTTFVDHLQTRCKKTVDCGMCGEQKIDKIWHYMEKHWKRINRFKCMCGLSFANFFQFQLHSGNITGKLFHFNMEENLQLNVEVLAYIQNFKNFCIQQKKDIEARKRAAEKAPVQVHPDRTAKEVRRKIIVILDRIKDATATSAKLSDRNKSLREENENLKMAGAVDSQTKLALDQINTQLDFLENTLSNNKERLKTAYINEGDVAILDRFEERIARERNWLEIKIATLKEEHVLLTTEQNALLKQENLRLQENNSRLQQSRNSVLENMQKVIDEHRQ